MCQGWCSVSVYRYGYLKVLMGALSYGEVLDGSRMLMTSLTKGLLREGGCLWPLLRGLWSSGGFGVYGFFPTVRATRPRITLYQSLQTTNHHHHHHNHQPTQPPPSLSLTQKERKWMVGWWLGLVVGVRESGKKYTVRATTSVFLHHVKGTKCYVSSCIRFECIFQIDLSNIYDVIMPIICYLRYALTTTIH